MLRQFIPLKVRRMIRPPWIMTAPNSSTPRVLDRFLFYAIVGTWMDEDIVYSTVANAFTQGVDAVFIIDNDSPDETVHTARTAGASDVIQYRTAVYDERYRIDMMDLVVQHISTHSSADNVWWLLMDADEFPRPAGGGTIRDLLRRLDSKFRIVGARFLNHYPSPGQTPHILERHPLECQPLCEELVSPVMCSQGHRKHPLFRWDRSGPYIKPSLGFHTAESVQKPLFEPQDQLVIHHFPFRCEAVTRARFQKLTETRIGPLRDHMSVTHMRARLQSIDAVYAGKWEDVISLHLEDPRRGVHLTHWCLIAPPVSQNVLRWYPA
jgi:hypothetical protein